MSQKYLVSLNGVDYVWDGNNVQEGEDGNLVFVYFDEGANLNSIAADRCDYIKKLDIIGSFDLDTLNPDTKKMESGGMGQHAILYKAIDDSGAEMVVRENWSDFSGFLSTGKILDVTDLYSLADTHPKAQQWVMYKNA
jgi:hypothetical protein